MEKFYNNHGWRRIRGLRDLGILALSVAFCLTGLLALSSCNDDDEAASAPAEPAPIEMRGFFTSVDEGGATDCTNGDVDLHEEEAGDLNEPNVRIIERGAAFGDAAFVQVGVKVGESDYNAETISTYYVSETNGNFDRPGAYFLVAKTDSAIQADTIYTGYWAGYAYRPKDPATGKNAVVICPYVMVPAGTPELEDIGENSCGGMDKNSTHPALAKYLMDDDGLRDCHNLLDAEGVLSPMQR